MRPFEFVIAALAIVFTYRALVVIFGQRRHARGRAEAQERHEDTEARLAGLEDRVRVLERIVTDSRADLNRQFRDLE